jgi:glycosyltransferase involved in cell wall biosynthesis
MVYRSARRVICISAKVRDRVVEGARAPVQTTVIYNGVNSEAFSPGTVGAESASVLSVGSLIPVKGHELLLRSFAAIQHLYPGICCDIVGKGPERSRLSTLASSLGITDKIRFLGPQTRSQVADAMRRCALFALPSRYEGLGCVYLEAMATEKAVIACHGQGIEEVIRQGFNGWLVEPEDLPALTNALLMLLENSDLRRRIGMAARETILAGFTLSHQASRLAEVYKECIE